MTSLFEITDQYRQLQQLEASEDLPIEVIQDTLEGLEGALEVKAVNVAKFVLNAEAMATAIEEASKRMKLRADRLRNRVTYVKDYLKSSMDAVQKIKIESPELVLSIKKNPPSVVIEDEKLIPFGYMVMPPPPPPPVGRPDKKLIGDALKVGTPVPGCKLDQGTRLEIKE